MIRLPLLLLSAGLASTLVAGPAGSVVPGPVTVYDSTTRITHLDNPVSRHERARVTVTVTLDGADYYPTGEIRLTVDGKPAGYRDLRGSQDEGTRVIRLDRLAPGVHLVKASFGGNYDATSSSSGVKRLRVER